MSHRERRGEPEDDPAHHGQGHGECHDAPVDVRVDVPRERSIGKERQQRAEAPDGERDTSNGTNGGERQSFHQQLSNQPRPIGTHRDSQGDLAAARRGPDELQIDDVRAGDEQKQQDRDEQRDKQLPSGA
jgi:hypothetical protein